MAKGKGRGSLFSLSGAKREVVVALKSETEAERLMENPEFVLALEAEVDQSGSLGRTGSRKVPDSPCSNGVLKNLSNKRVKTSNGMEEQATNLEKSMSKVPIRRFTRSSLVSNKVNNGENFFREGGSCAERPFLVDSNNMAQNDSISRPTRRFTRSLLQTSTVSQGGDGASDVQKTTMEKTPMQAINLDLEQVVETHNNISSTKPLKQFIRRLKYKTESMAMNGKDRVEEEVSLGEKSGNHVEIPIMIDDIESNEVNDTNMVKPVRRFTRSCLKPKLTDENREVRIASLEKSGEPFTCTKCKNGVEPAAIVSDEEVKSSSNENPSSQLTHSSLEPNEDEPVIIADSRQDLNGLSKKPEGESNDLILEVKEDPSLMSDNGSLQKLLLDRPLRPFTRSAQKVSCSSTFHDDGCENKRAPDDERKPDIVRLLRKTPKKKLEMKMSKKISLTKLPSKIEELLDTGMLEGLPVKYILAGEEDGDLRGTIKGSGILCFCVSCKGCNVITPTQFEQHAGSKNRNTASHIYLDNGRSLHDLLIACKSAPLDLLEATIQHAIRSTIKSSTCLTCKRHLPATRASVAASLCGSCLELKRSQTKSGHTSGTISRHPKFSDSKLKSISPKRKKSEGKLTKKDLRLHKLVFEGGNLPDGTELAYYARGQKVLEGYKKGSGIFCRCCETEISPSQFEAHAGYAPRRKPYLHIYTSNGVSLHELSISLSKGRKFSVNDNDDLCSICADYGDLLLCDGCPRAFHRDCVGETSIPWGDWYCHYCQNMFEREKNCMNNQNAVAAGRVLGVDPIEQISNRCIRIVQTAETEVGGCSLCRCTGFSKSGFGPQTVILCDQCEKEFHVGCLKDHKMANLKELPKGKWFCSAICRRVHSALHKMIVCGSVKLPDSISSAIKKKQQDKCLSNDADIDIRWQLLRGQIASTEIKSLLSKAVSIFHKCFDPIVDSTTRRDLIPSMVYGRNSRGQEFGGMYCAVLTVNSSVVSAGILRIFGNELAELPLVATSSDYQGQGYFTSLFSCLERFLGSLKVKNLVLPAADEAKAIWTDKFDFKIMSHDQLSMYRKDYPMTSFKGTSMLQKSLLSSHGTSYQTTES